MQQEISQITFYDLKRMEEVKRQMYGNVELNNQKLTYKKVWKDSKIYGEAEKMYSELKIYPLFIQKKNV